MSRTENIELATICLVEDGNKILVQNRTKEDWKGYALPGGHVEPGESIVDSIKREVKEETGLDIKDPRIVGIKQFEIENGRYLILLFKATEFSGVLSSSHEGDVEWVEYNQLSKLDTVEDFDALLKVMNNPELNELLHIFQDDEWFTILK